VREQLAISSVAHRHFDAFGSDAHLFNLYGGPPARACSRSCSCQINFITCMATRRVSSRVCGIVAQLYKIWLVFTYIHKNIVVVSVVSRKSHRWRLEIPPSVHTPSFSSRRCSCSSPFPCYIICVRDAHAVERVYSRFIRLCCRCLWLATYLYAIQCLGPTSSRQ